MKVERDLDRDEVVCHRDGRVYGGRAGNYSFLLEEPETPQPHSQPRAPLDLALVHLRIGVSNPLGVMDA